MGGKRVHYLFAMLSPFQPSLYQSSSLPIQVRIFGQTRDSAAQDRVREEALVRPQGQEAPVSGQRKQSENPARDEPGKKNWPGCR